MVTRENYEKLRGLLMEIIRLRDCGDMDSASLYVKKLILSAINEIGLMKAGKFSIGESRDVEFEIVSIRAEKGEGIVIGLTGRWMSCDAMIDYFPTDVQIEIAESIVNEARRQILGPSFFMHRTDGGQKLQYRMVDVYGKVNAHIGRKSDRSDEADGTIHAYINSYEFNNLDDEQLVRYMEDHKGQVDLVERA